MAQPVLNRRQAAPAIYEQPHATSRSVQTEAFIGHATDAAILSESPFAADKCDSHDPTPTTKDLGRAHEASFDTDDTSESGQVHSLSPPLLQRPLSASIGRP